MKKSIIVIDNDDKLCLSRAISVCTKWEASQQKLISRHEWTKMACSKSFDQAVMAMSLIRKIGMSEQDCSSLTSISSYESHLNANIDVVGASQHNRFIYPKELNPAYTCISYVYFVEVIADNHGHFHAIKSITGLLSLP